jgi:hypothetical protein
VLIRSNLAVILISIASTDNNRYRDSQYRLCYGDKVEAFVVSSQQVEVGSMVKERMSSCRQVERRKEEQTKVIDDTQL